MHYGPMMIDLAGTALSAVERDLLQHPRVGGVIFFARNYTDIPALKKLIQDIRSIATKPLLLAVDHEGGRVWRFKEGFTLLPAAKKYGIGYKQDPTIALKNAHDAGWIMATELLDCGIDFSLAPVLDVDTGLSAVIGDRAFHSDPLVTTALAKSFILGMNTVGMQATGKHFPGHGGCVLDSHIAKPIDERTLEELFAADLMPFQNLYAQLGAIMPALVTYPAIDSVPACFSKRWLYDILRVQLKFSGAIMSDCLSMKGASVAGDFIQRAQMALDAGCDMVILCQQTREQVAWVLDNLDRNANIESSERLALMAGKFQMAANLKAKKPTLMA